MIPDQLPAAVAALENLGQIQSLAWQSEPHELPFPRCHLCQELSGMFVDLVSRSRVAARLADTDPAGLVGCTAYAFAAADAVAAADL